MDAIHKQALESKFLRAKSEEDIKVL